MTALQAALGAAPNSNTQANYLSGLRESLERNPLPIKVFATLLIARTHAGSDFWLLKDWCLDLFHFALTKSTLSIDDKTWCQY
jgi:symplekin